PPVGSDRLEREVLVDIPAGDEGSTAVLQRTRRRIRAAVGKRPQRLRVIPAAGIGQGSDAPERRRSRFHVRTARRDARCSHERGGFVYLPEDEGRAVLILFRVVRAKDDGE